MTRWLETDSLSNQDISSALAIGAYTANADRLVMVQFFADQVAGNGDYVFYVTQQVAGAGSHYRLIPITTAAAASGLTSIGGQSGMIAVRSGDVLTVYLDGLAGDTTTPDTTVRWFELAALRPTTADLTLDVSAGGEAGIDWANIGSPTTTVALSGTTIKSATDVEADSVDIQSRLPAALVSGRMDVSVGAVASGAITAAAIATDAITADKIASSAITAGKIATGAITAAAIAADAIGSSELAADAVAEIADAVLDEVYTTHATAYTLGAFLNATDPTTVTVTSSNDAGELTLYRGVTFAATVSGLTISASWTKIVFTVKTDLDLADTASTIQIVESNPGVGTDGLLYLNGAALASPITAADASLTVTQAAGTVAIALSDDATALLSRARSVHWDLKQWVSSATTLLTSGSADIELTPTRTV